MSCDGISCLWLHRRSSGCLMACLLPSGPETKRPPCRSPGAGPSRRPPWGQLCIRTAGHFDGLIPWLGRGLGSSIHAQTSTRRNHGSSSGVHGVDDLGVVDSLEVDRRDPQVGVPELALDHHQRDTLVSHLDSMCVSELVGRKSAPHPGHGGGSLQLPAS